MRKMFLIILKNIVIDPEDSDLIDSKENYEVILKINTLNYLLNYWTIYKHNIMSLLQMISSSY